MKREAVSFTRLEGEHWWFRGRRKVYLSHLRAAMGGVRVHRALDLGGGDGGFTRSLVAFAEKVVEVDSRPEDLDTANGADACIAGQPEALPFGDRRFDLVTLFDVLEHVEDEGEALAEARRVLRPGGLVMLSVPAYDWLYAHHDGGAASARRYTRARLRRALEAADFVVERVTHANVVLFPLVAPTVLLFKLLALLRVVPTSARHTNLSVPTPPWLSALLYRAFTSELSITGRFDLPFGNSIVAIARRPVPARTKRVRRNRRSLSRHALPAAEPAGPLPSEPRRTPAPGSSTAPDGGAEAFPPDALLPRTTPRDPGISEPKAPSTSTSAAEPNAD